MRITEYSGLNSIIAFPKTIFIIMCCGEIPTIYEVQDVKLFVSKMTKDIQHIQLVTKTPIK